MLIARRVDETMWTLRRQGKGHFVVSSAGHEAIGAARPGMKPSALPPGWRSTQHRTSSRRITAT
jgi:TPP-dependent pyruvate/acetoin dehydrogenase alpha subunit